MVPTVLYDAGTVPQSGSHWCWSSPYEASACSSEREPPTSAAGLEVPPPASSTSSASLLDDSINPVDTDSGLTANEAAVITSDEIIYNPFDRAPGEEVVKVIPRDRSRSPSRS